jgi:hypothetical protein
MKKMNKEFEELMFTKTEGKMLEQLTVSVKGPLKLGSPGLRTRKVRTPDSLKSGLLW